MLITFFILPILVFLLFEVYKFKTVGAKNRLRDKWFWVQLLCTETFSLAALCVLFMSFTAFLEFSLIKLMACAITSVSFVGLLKLALYVKGSKKLLAALAFAAFMAIFLEITLFNFRFYQTYNYEETDLTDKYEAVHFSETENADREYEIVTSSVTPYLLINGIDQKVYNVYLDLTAKNSNGNTVSAQVTPYLTDLSNENLFRVPAQTVIDGVEATKYLHLITNGESERLKLNITSDYGETFTVNSLRINVSQPFSFKLIRFFVVAILIFILYLLRPKSPLWSVAFSGSYKQKLIVTAIIAVQIALLIGVSFFNPKFQVNPLSHTSQYQELAESFLEGRLYLDAEPPEYLAEMENPYDYGARTEAKNEHKESYHWDAAYFDGKYYVYFGVVPVLLTYLPFRALTGSDLPNAYAVRFFMVFFVIGAFLLVAEILKKYFNRKRIPFLAYILTSLVLVNSSGCVFIAKRPDFYSVPILAGLAFTMLGLYFWLRSLKKEESVHAGYAALGSLCMALVAGCRPQLLVVSAFAFLFFWNAVFKERALFSKKGAFGTVAICLPYLIVAAGIMWYNYARFGSPFDFGQNYNLTTNDMTGRGFRVERVGLALFTYFFQLPNITASFPFLQSVRIDTNYLGTTITESMFGGVFAVIPFLWCLALLPAVAKRMKKGHRLALCLLPLGLSLFIGAFDAQGAGLLQRYISDFAFLSILAAMAVTFFLYEKTRGRLRGYINGFLMSSAFAGFAYSFLLIFAKYGYEIYYHNPHLFNYVAELVQFW